MSFGSHAQPEAPSTPAIRAVTLPQAVADARANQPAIRAALSRVSAQRVAAAIPRAQRQPVVGLTAQIFGATANNTTGTYVDPFFMDIPRVGGRAVASPGSLLPYGSTIVAAGATLDLFDFGRIAAQSAAADALVEVEGQRARSTLLDVTFDVEEAYFAVFAAKSVLRSSEEAYDRAFINRDFTSRQIIAGIRKPVDLARAEADLAQFDLGRVRARGGLEIGQSVLAAAAGANDALLTVTETPPRPEEMPALGEAIRQAGIRDPRILETLAALSAEEKRTRAIAAELRPDISLTGTISGRAGGAPASGASDAMVGAGFVPYVPNWDVGLVLSWPLFDATVSARADASRAREETRRQEIAQVRFELAAAVRKSYIAVEVARAALPALERAVTAARVNYDQADAYFRNGLGTTVDRSDAATLLTQAEIQLVLGQFELARARAQFGRTIAEGI